MFFAIEFRYITDSLFEKDRLPFIWRRNERDACKRFKLRYPGALAVKFKSRKDMKQKSTGEKL